MTMLSHYEKNTCKIADMNEFREDMMKFIYVHRLIEKYKESGKLNVRLVLNHIIILYNVFGSFTTKYFLEETPEEIKPEVFGLLLYLSRLPEDFILSANPKIIDVIEEVVNA